MIIAWRPSTIIFVCESSSVVDLEVYYSIAAAAIVAIIVIYGFDSRIPQPSVDSRWRMALEDDQTLVFPMMEQILSVDVTAIISREHVVSPFLFPLALFRA